ncbi:hypothetical protein V1506DRAFT_444626, partial [Lipomyces tetrasporus]
SRIADYNQYVFTGPKGRWHADHLRKVIREQTGNSTKLLAPMNAQSLRQAIVALLDQHTGHLSAVNNAGLNFAEDVQSGHTTHVATTYYAIGTDDLPHTNRNDLQEFLNVSDRWIQFLVGVGNISELRSLPRDSSFLQPSHIGQSLEQSTPSVVTRDPSQMQITTVVKQITEVYPRLSNARLLPTAPETFCLLKELRGVNAIFKSPYQAAAMQTIISNPGDSHLVVLPTGGGKSDIVFVSSLYERKRGRITVLALPFVALRYDLINRAKQLGMNVIEWSSELTRDAVTTADIIVLPIESMDSHHFRQQFTKLLIAKDGHSAVARIFFDEAHTILSQWKFRPSFQGVSELTSLQVPMVLL